MKQRDRDDFAATVTELRTVLGLTQEQFAARLGVTFSTVNRWETGKSRPSPLAQRQIDSLRRDLHGKDSK